MSDVKLTRPDVAARYNVNVKKDLMIHTNGYSGKLSKVNLKGAESLVKSKTGYLTPKASASTAGDSEEPS